MNETKRRIERTKPLLFTYRIFLPFVDLNKFLASFRGLFWYLRDIVKYMIASKKWLINFDLYPILDEKTKITDVDYQYLYQQIWVFNEVNKLKPNNHYDVSSTYQMSCYLAGITNAHFIDLRPIEADIDNLHLLKGEIENLPFEDNSLESLSCLHVIEHIGLGRYGDKLNVDGPKIACKELSRVVKPGGYLYLSTPIGRERICFNAHHVFNPLTILKYCKDLELVEFSMVDDEGKLHKDMKVKGYQDKEYSLGMFKFIKNN
jgi:SAM-dependent methyltransferase